MALIILFDTIYGSQYTILKLFFLEYKTTIANGIICRVYLGTIYLAEIENFFAKSIIDKAKR